jgi:hypothetical protein
MLPQVASLTDLDVYRDGGSVSASFQGVDGDSYTLFFRIVGGPAHAEPPTYEVPRLDRYTPTDYKSPITGVADPDWKKHSEPVSWADARVLLDALAPHVRGFVSTSGWVYETMRDTAKGDGDPTIGAKTPPNKSLERTREG